MPASDRRSRIVRRAARVGLHPPAELVAELDAYLELLAKWNTRINLTALPVDPLGDEAVDRLVIEPLEAARHVKDSDRVAVDVGSGGGSPAIPLKLAAPHLHMVLVESKVRKAAFLREVVRTLGLTEIEVANCRFDAFESAPVHLVTLRAVRPDLRLVMGITSLLRPGGRLLWFISFDPKLRTITKLPDLELESEHRLTGGGSLAIFRRPSNWM